MCDAPLRTPPGWTAYMDALRSLGERGHLGSIASAELVRAGKALAVTAFEVGADAMAAAAGEQEPVPSPMQLRAMARPNTPVPCRPGGHCERHARGLGGCIAGECNPPAASVFDATLIPKMIMTREQEAIVRRGGCPKCMERSLGVPTQGGGIEFRHCKRCSSIYAYGAGGEQP